MNMVYGPNSAPLFAGKYKVTIPDEAWSNRLTRASKNHHYDRHSRRPDVKNGLPDSFSDVIHQAFGRRSGFPVVVDIVKNDDSDTYNIETSLPQESERLNVTFLKYLFSSFGMKEDIADSVVINGDTVELTIPPTEREKQIEAFQALAKTEVGQLSAVDANEVQEAWDTTLAVLKPSTDATVDAEPDTGIEKEVIQRVLTEILFNADTTSLEVSRSDAEALMGEGYIDLLTVLDEKELYKLKLHPANSLYNGLLTDKGIDNLKDLNQFDKLNKTSLDNLYRYLLQMTVMNEDKTIDLLGVLKENGVDLNRNNDELPSTNLAWMAFDAQNTLLLETLEKAGVTLIAEDGSNVDAMYRLTRNINSEMRHKAQKPYVPAEQLAKVYQQIFSHPKFDLDTIDVNTLATMIAKMNSPELLDTMIEKVPNFLAYDDVVAAIIVSDNDVMINKLKQKSNRLDDFNDNQKKSVLALYNFIQRAVDLSPSNSYLEIVRTLQKHGIDLNRKYTTRQRSRNEDLAMLAVKESNLPLLQALEVLGVELENTYNIYEQNLLHLAAEYGSDSNIFRFLRDNNVSATEKDILGFSAFGILRTEMPNKIKLEQPEVRARARVLKGKNPDGRGKDPISFAVKHGQWQQVDSSKK